MNDRSARGLLIPLFACPSTASWGIGDIGDLPPLTAWLAAAGQRVLQLLPINEMAPGQQSPYSAISAMAIDPIFIAVPLVPDFAALGGEDSLGDDDRARLALVRNAARIEYAEIRALKKTALRAAFSRFFETEWCRDTGRSRSLKTFLSEQAWWIEDYALFRAIHAREDERPWTQWPEALQRREPAEIDHARRELSREVLFQQYLQWIADAQWKDARAPTRTASSCLATCRSWSTATARTSGRGRISSSWMPRSACRPMPSARPGRTGACRSIAGTSSPRRISDGCASARAAAPISTTGTASIISSASTARTAGRETAATPFLRQPTRANRKRSASMFSASCGPPAPRSSPKISGPFPISCAASLARLGIPGFRVFRWERHWHADGQPFRDPADYPPVSVAASGTHDTEPLVVWWQTAPEDERQKVNALAVVQRLTDGAGILDADEQHGS